MAVAAKRKPRRKQLAPFSVKHFERWARELVLDTGRRWKLEPFQAAFLEDVFSGVPECWFVVPEGNGKTTLLAGLVLYHVEFTPDAWVPVGASSRDQARILYRQAKGFVHRTPRLDRVFRCYDGYRRITHEGGGTVEVFAADQRTGDGVIPSWCVIDELHRHKNLDLYLTWSGKLDKRGAQLLTISTAGEPGGEFEETREKIRQGADVLERDGCHVRAVSETTALHEWAVPEEADPDDLELVKAANPFSGVTPELLRRKRGRETMTLEHWRRFTCNLPTRSGLAAINEQEWENAICGEPIPEGEPVWVGLDVGWRWDTTAVVPLWWRDDEHRQLGPAVVLVPPRDGTSLDPAKIKRAFVELAARNPIETVVMDVTDANELAEWLSDEFDAPVVERRASPKEASADYARFMEALRNGWLKHAGDRPLRQHALNAVARILPLGDARFDRPSTTRMGSFQDRRVVDALVAAAMVHSVAVAELAGGEVSFELIG